MVDNESLDGMLRLKKISPEAFVPADDYDTLVELCRQQHEVVNWYAEKARSLERYFKLKGGTSIEAVMTELGLDGGKRAVAVLALWPEEDSHE